MAKKGERLSDETKAKISKSRRGKYHTEESKKKMSEARKGKRLSPETKKKISEGSKGKHFGKFTPEHCANLSKSKKGNVPWNKGIPCSEETKQNISNAVKGEKHANFGKKRPNHSKRMLGRNNPNFGKKAAKSHGCWYINKWDGSKIWLRSGWEVKVANYLYDNCIIYEYECKTFDLGETTYTPDFYLVVEDKFIEVKGYMRPYAKAKIQLFKEKFPDVKYEIWNKQILDQFGILSGDF